MKSCIIIPAYNEAVRIGQVVQNILEAGFDVLVVNDGSKDDTAAVLRGLPIIYAEHPVNQGQGAALRTGTELAGELGYEAVVHFDADGQHQISDIPRLVQVLETGRQVALGSRFMGVESNLPTQKKVMYGFAKIFSRFILQLKFTDPQSGLRAFRLSAYDRICWQKNDFQHCSEILSNIMKNEVVYEEIPVEIVYDEYSQSKVVKPKLSLGLKLVLSKIFDWL
jgi:glycosyltransferase involved in cell wall biosynthesis